MKVVKEAKSAIMKIWGKQTIKNSKYRPIYYMLSVPADDELLLYHVMTEELLALDAEERAEFEKFSGNLSRENILGNFADGPKPVLEELIRKHFLVPVDYDEAKAVDQLRLIINRMKPKGKFTSYAILPTTYCNARCFYCYESDYRHENMTEEIAHRLVEFIMEHCDKEDMLHLHWFGGEPLVGINRIDQICDELRENGYQYASRMTSNAYLFTEEVVKRAKENWNLQSIQITLDGTEDIYNQTKSYKNIKGSPYYRVLDNVEYLVKEDIHVQLRMNLGWHNAENLRDLINELGDRFSEYKSFVAYVGILFDGKGFETVHHTTEDKIGLLKVQQELETLITAQGISANKNGKLPGLKVAFCMADNDKGLLVNPLGGFGKCEHGIFDGLVGSIENDQLDQKMVDAWKKPIVWEKCRTCPLHPSCYFISKCENVEECLDVKQEYDIKGYQTLVRRTYKAWKENISKKHKNNT